jgi:hypothetical protein
MSAILAKRAGGLVGGSGVGAEGGDGAVVGKPERGGVVQDPLALEARHPAPFEAGFGVLATGGLCLRL